MLRKYLFAVDACPACKPVASKSLPSRRFASGTGINKIFMPLCEPRKRLSEIRFMWISPNKYNAWYETPLGSLCDKLEKDAIFTLFKPKGFVLDIGCGTGNYTYEIKKRGGKAIGMDTDFYFRESLLYLKISPDMVAMTMSIYKQQGFEFVLFNVIHYYFNIPARVYDDSLA